MFLKNLCRPFTVKHLFNVDWSFCEVVSLDDVKNACFGCSGPLSSYALTIFRFLDSVSTSVKNSKQEIKFAPALCRQEQFQSETLMMSCA